MIIITERNIPKPVKLLTESVDGEAFNFIQGVFVECDIINKNGRIYPSEVMKPVLEQYIQEKVALGRAYGELDHPESLVVNPKNISHRIIELAQNGNQWIGKAILTDTPSGNIVKGILKSGGQVGVSTRGGGEVDFQDGADVIKEFFLTTAGDIVLDPSAPSAYVNGLMEGIEWARLPDGTFQKKAVDRIVKENKYFKKQQLVKFAQLLENHLRLISGK